MSPKGLQPQNIGVCSVKFQDTEQCEEPCKYIFVADWPISCGNHYHSRFVVGGTCSDEHTEIIRVDMFIEKIEEYDGTEDMLMKYIGDARMLQLLVAD